MAQQLSYIFFDEKDPEGSLLKLRDMVKEWERERDKMMFVTDDVLNVLKSIAKKQFSSDGISINKMTVELKDKEFVDIIYNDSGDIIEICFGPMSRKRQSYRPSKKAKSKVCISLEPQ